MTLTRSLLATAVCLTAAWSSQDDPVEFPELKAPDKYTLVGERSFLSDYPARSEDGRLHVVVEIPAGTTQKWEVDKKDGALRWEFKKGKPRVVSYLGYPGNYGMVPRTLLPEELGGDGDPLDVLVLGPAMPRGSVVRVRVLGVLQMLDGGEKDDKILAVVENSALAQAGSIQELQEQFPGVLTIVETWFENYKGPGEIECSGFLPAADAERVIDEAIRAYETSR